MSAKRRILDVGNCGPDHRAICKMLANCLDDVEVVQAHGAEDTMSHLRLTRFDLVLINRKLDQDYTDGIEILKLIKTDTQTGHIPVMLITNFEEHQRAAVELGALPGFGKLDIGAERPCQAIAEALSQG